MSDAPRGPRRRMFAMFVTETHSSRTLVACDDEGLELMTWDLAELQCQGVQQSGSETSASPSSLSQLRLDSFSPPSLVHPDVLAEAIASVCSQYENSLEPEDGLLLCSDPFGASSVEACAACDLEPVLRSQREATEAGRLAAADAALASALQRDAEDQAIELRRAEARNFSRARDLARRLEVRDLDVWRSGKEGALAGWCLDGAPDPRHNPYLCLADYPELGEKGPGPAHRRHQESGADTRRQTPCARAASSKVQDRSPSSALLEDDARWPVYREEDFAVAGEQACAARSWQHGQSSLQSLPEPADRSLAARVLALAEEQARREETSKRPGSRQRPNSTSPGTGSLETPTAISTDPSEFSSKSLRKLVRDMYDHGWRPAQHKRAGHYRLERRIAALGDLRQVALLASTPSDRNYIWMVRAAMLRADREVAERLAALGEEKEKGAAGPG